MFELYNYSVWYVLYVLECLKQNFCIAAQLPKLPNQRNEIEWLRMSAYLYNACTVYSSLEDDIVKHGGK